MSISTVRYTLRYSINGKEVGKRIYPIDRPNDIKSSSEDYKKVLSTSAKYVLYNDASHGIFDFDLIKTIESINIFQRNYIDVEKLVNGIYVFSHILYFSIIDCIIDNDRCTCEIKPDAEDRYTCIYDDWETEYNVLKEVQIFDPYIIVNPVDLETFTCSKSYNLYVDPNGSCARPLTYNLQGGLVFNDAAETGASKGLPYDLPAVGGLGPDDNYDTHPYYNTWTVFASSGFFTPAFQYYPVSGAWQSITDIMNKFRILNNKVTVNYASNPSNSLIYNVTVETTWCAEVVFTLNNPITNAYNPPSGSGWINIKDSSLNGQLGSYWAREPFYNDQTYVYNHVTDNCNMHNYELINPYSQNSALRLDIYRGRGLNETIQMFLNKSGCGLTLKSKFLQDLINPVTGEPNPKYVLNQCSDIKDPDSTEPASFMFVSFREVLEYLQGLKCEWYIDGQNLIIEHISYFKNGYSYTSQAQQPYDLRSKVEIQTGKPEIIATNKYSYDVSNIYKSESLSSNQYLDYDFSKLTINYDLSTNKEDKSKQTVLTFISDVTGVYSEPSAFNSDSIVICAVRNEVINPISGQTAYVCFIENGYRTNKAVTNGWLSISNIFNRFWRDNMIMISGTIENDQQESFDSQSDKILQEVLVKDCDMSIFADKNIVRTNLGVGRVIESTHDLIMSTTRLTILI